MATKIQHQQSRQAGREAERGHRGAPEFVVWDQAVNVTAAVLLAISLWAVYARVLPKPFIYDDAISVQANPSITRLWPLLGDAGNPGPLNPPNDLPTSGRPLVNLSFAVNYWFGGLNPAGYRGCNVVLHFLSALLVMVIMRRTLRLPCFGGRLDAAAGPLAVAVALLWAVHPLQTESVAYVTQRTELMMGFCYLATLYAALRYWAALPLPPGEGRGEGNFSLGTRRAWLAVAVLACGTGMASKEVMVSAPLVVLLFDWTFVHGSLRRIWRESWPLYAGLAATWVVLLVLNVVGSKSSSAGFHLGLSPWVWWATQAKVLWMYLKLAVWPWPLVISYELPYLSTWTAAWPWLLLTAALVAGSLALLWRQRAVGFVGVSVLAILSPTLIVPILSEIAAERRMYLPLAGLVALAVVGGFALVQKLAASGATDRVPNNWRSLGIFAAAIAVLALLGSLVSARRLAAYENVMTLWQDALVHQPDNFIASYNLASCLVAKGRVVEAIPYYRRAVELRPNVWKARNSLGEALVAVGRTNEAVPQFEEALRLNPSDFQVYTRLAEAYVRTNQPVKAVAVAEQAAELARSAGQTPAVTQIETWLRDYRAEQSKASGTAPTAVPKRRSFSDN